MDETFKPNSVMFVAGTIIIVADTEGEGEAVRYSIRTATFKPSGHIEGPLELSQELVKKLMLSVNIDALQAILKNLESIEGTRPDLVSQQATPPKGILQ